MEETLLTKGALPLCGGARSGRWWIGIGRYETGAPTGAPIEHECAVSIPDVARISAWPMVLRGFRAVRGPSAADFRQMITVVVRCHKRP